MRAARRRIQDTTPQQGASVLLNLSLFLMLLAFFLVMNSVSSFEESKYHPILKNLKMTFSTNIPGEEAAPSLTADPIESINEGETIERIDALFNAQITGFEATKSGSRGVMMVSVPIEEFDRAMTTAGQIDITQAQRSGSLQTFFLPTLVSLLRAQEQGTPYRLDLILHSRDNPGLLHNSDPRALAGIRRNVAGYAALLEKAGLESPLLNIGIMQGDPGFVTLYFRPLESKP